MSLVGDLDATRGQAMIAFGWAIAEELAAGSYSRRPLTARASVDPAALPTDAAAASSLGAQRVAVRDRAAARVVLADVRGRGAVDERSRRRGAGSTSRPVAR